MYFKVIAHHELGVLFDGVEFLELSTEPLTLLDKSILPFLTIVYVPLHDIG